MTSLDPESDAFKAWQLSRNPREYPAERQAFYAGWLAAIQAPEVQALREALHGLLQLDEENHQRYAGDDDVCKEVRDARAALAALEKQK